MSFAVQDRAEVEAWVAHLDEQSVENSGPRIAAIGYIVFFHDPDGIKAGRLLLRHAEPGRDRGVIRAV